MNVYSSALAFFYTKKARCQNKEGGNKSKGIKEKNTAEKRFLFCCLSF
jgi:hypothetical protein